MNHCYVTNTCDWAAIHNLFIYFHHSILQIFTDVPMEIIARSVCSVQCIGKYLLNEAFDEPRQYGEIDSCHINVNLGNLYRFLHADSVWRSGLLSWLTFCFSMAEATSLLVVPPLRRKTKFTSKFRLVNKALLLRFLTFLEIIHRDFSLIEIFIPVINKIEWYQKRIKTDQNMAKMYFFEGYPWTYFNNNQHFYSKLHYTFMMHNRVHNR